LSVCLFVCRFFVCPSRYDARHRKPRRCVYALNLGGTGIRPPDSFSYRSNFRFRSSFRSRSRSRSRSSSCSTASGDIIYCSGSRQLNHSSYICCCIHPYIHTPRCSKVAWPSVQLSSLHYSSLTSVGADSCVNIVGMISSPS